VMYFSPRTPGVLRKIAEWLHQGASSPARS